MSRSITLAIEGRRAPLPVTAVTGREALSALFELTATLAGDADEAAAAIEIGARATLFVAHGPRTRTIHGIVKAFEQGDAGAPHGRVALVPAAYVLALREDCRVFSGRRAPEIVEAVLAAAGLEPDDYRFALRGDYGVREHCIQYRENDWTFLSRLLASEGIHCFFEHGDARAVLVFADAPGAHADMAAPSTLPFRPGGGALETGERVTHLRHVEELRPGKVALRGHSFKAPRARLESRAEARRAGGAIYDAPPAFDAPDAGDRLARLRLEQESVAAAAAHGASDALGLVPGVVFSLDGHAETRMNRRWLVTSMEHEFAVEDAGARAGAARYANRFTAIAADVPFRPRSTPPPPVGIQTAVVVGPAGQSVHCDELGRVKVQFAWDREGRLDDQSSSWIRVSQAWAGGGHGALFVPRIGDEVLVDFVGGDVDRPVIVGSVYNGENLPPSSLPADRTAAVLRADSTPGREGTSELRIEAQSGRERVKLVAFRDLDVRVGEDRDETVAGDETARVGGDRERAVEGEESIAVRKDRGLAVGGSHGVTVGGDEDRTIGGDHAVAVGGDRTLDVTGKLTDIVGEHLVVRVGGNRTDTVLGASREAVVGERAVVAGRQTVEVKASSELDVGGDADVRVGGALKTRVGELTELVCGAATITVHADGTVELEGRDVVVKVAGAVTVEGERLSVRSQGSVDVSAGGSVRVRGRGVSFN